MDQHDLVGVSPQALAEAHTCDLEHQGRYGVRFISYWHHERASSGFCLVEAPDPAAVQAVHLAAHGNVPNRIIEVDWKSVEGFMGPIREPEPGVPWEDIAARTILCAEAGAAPASPDERTTVAQQSRRAVARATLARGGTPVERTRHSAFGCFASTAAAMECALALQGSLAPLASLYDGAPVRMRIGIAVGDPVDGRFGLFGRAVHLASVLCAGARPGTTLVSSDVFELESSKQFRFTPLRDLTVEGERPVRIYRLDGRRETDGGAGEAAASAGVAGLSPRQVEIVRLIAQGRTNREIADQLCLSHSTVATHVRNIFERTGASNRAEAASFGFRKGLL